LHSKKIGLLSALLCVILLSLFGSLQGVMSEHICMAFFMPALYLVLKSNKPYWFLLSGLLMGMALMTKMNIAYAVLFCCLFIFYSDFKNRNRINRVFRGTLYGAGVLIIIGLTILPYYISGITEVWWNSVVLAPLEYASAQQPSIFKVAPFFIVIIGFFIFAWKKQWINFRDSNIQLMLVAILGVLIAFYKGGKINGHYLIQLHPMLVLFVVLVLNQVEFVKKLKWKPYYLILIFLIPMESYLEYGNIIRNKVERGTFFNGEGFSVPNYIKDAQLETENVLFLGYHIGYWNLNAKPPAKSATHPSNICREELFAYYGNPRKKVKDELQYIMDTLQPKLVIVRKNRSVFDIHQVVANEYIDAYLLKHYQLKATVENAEILQRLD